MAIFHSYVSLPEGTYDLVCFKRYTQSMARLEIHSVDLFSILEISLALFEVWLLKKKRICRYLQCWLCPLRTWTVYWWWQRLTGKGTAKGKSTAKGKDGKGPPGPPCFTTMWIIQAFKLHCSPGHRRSWSRTRHSTSSRVWDRLLGRSHEKPHYG